MSARHLLFFVSEDWYFVSHRLPLAIAAKDAGFTVSVVTRVRHHAATIEGAGLRLIPFELARSGLNPFRELVTLGRLILLYRRERPDIAHHVAMKPVLYGGIAAWLGGNPPRISALAGMGWLFTSTGGLARFLKHVVRFALSRVLHSGLTLVQNPDDAQLLIELGVPRGGIRIIAGSGVDLERFRPSPEPEGRPVVVLQSRLLWDKGVGEFVEAARILASRGIDARFVLAGQPDDSNPAAIPAERIRQWVADGIVEHRGWVTDVPRLLASAHIVCLPSYREGLPKSLIEAAASGRAIVTTSVSGCRHVVDDEETGLLVPPRNAEALAGAIARLIRDPTLRQGMGARARARAEREFGAQSVIRQTLALYEESSA
jgi:glycosyltransferase involved in cell wall biosynthesis